MERPKFPEMPPMVSGMVPSTFLRPIDPDTGIFKGWLEKKRVSQLVEITDGQRQIAENLRAIDEANKAVMRSNITFSADVQMVFRRYDHETQMMDKDRTKADLEIERMKMENSKLQVECQVLYFNAKEAESSSKIADMEAKARMKAMQQEYGDDF